MSEFPSDWHRQAHLDALRRELETVRGRRNTAENLLRQAKLEEDGVLDQLERLDPKPKPKPRKKAS